MGNDEHNKGFTKRVLIALKLLGGLAIASVLAFAGWNAVAVSSIGYDLDKQVVTVGDHGWGAEVFDAIHDSAIADGLVRPANACGLGASSCFRCHNGQRAAEPNTDPVKAPWHVQHAKVNNSCVGCHNGNPRLMREQMAHQNLIGNPRATPSESCASCHRSEAELKGLVDLYLKIGE